MSADNWYGPEAATLGDRLAAGRERTGLSRAELARRLGVRDATVKSWEEDRSEPRANRLSTIAGMLGVSVMWLLHGEGAGVPGPDAEAMDDGGRAASAELQGLRRLLAEAGARIERLERLLDADT